MVPANFPFSFSSSSADLTLSRAAFARTGPAVPGVQASGIATSSAEPGDVIRTAQPDQVQPRPKGPQLSRWALASPQDSSCFFVHSLASFISGEPVSRGPMRSIISEAESMTLEFVKPSRRIRVTMSRSTASVAGRAELGEGDEADGSDQAFQSTPPEQNRGTVPPGIPPVKPAGGSRVARRALAPYSFSPFGVQVQDPRHDRPRRAVDLVGCTHKENPSDVQRTSTAISPRRTARARAPSSFTSTSGSGPFHPTANETGDLQ